MSCGARRARLFGIGEHGTETAKPDCDLAASGSRGGDISGVALGEEAGGENIGGDAHAGKPRVVDQQQRESGADFTVRDEGAVEYVCEKDLCD